ncbi:MAG: hypothetical protein GC149_04050 [Gammaproteobacteria bacterium]|nr:hypothetical protein [Gammaproteobacteria bacterium]
MDINFNIFDFHQPILQGILLVLLFGISLWIAWSPLKKIRAHYQLQRLINRLGHAALRHVTLMDGADIPIYIEYLILQSTGLLLLIIKPYRGNIFAALKIQNWTQVVRHHSFKFANPLYELETNLQAIRAMIPKVNVQGLVVFAQGAAFPKGKPEFVCDYDMLKRLAHSHERGELPASVRSAWEQLGSSVQQDKKLHPTILYQRGDRPRLIFGIFLLIGCLIYAIWLLVQLYGTG